jgi:hypothetical protein
LPEALFAGHCESVTLSAPVQAIVRLGQMPSDDDDVDENVVRRWVEALDGLDARLTDEEAVALLVCFPPDRSDLYEVAWGLLHAVESAPYGPTLLAQLDDRSSWVTYLRERAERGGLLPPRTQK